MWFWIAAFAAALAALLYISYRFVESTRDSWTEEGWLIRHALRELCAELRDVCRQIRAAAQTVRDDEYELFAPHAETVQPQTKLFNLAEDPWPAAPHIHAPMRRVEPRPGRWIHREPEHAGATADWSPTGEQLTVTTGVLTPMGMLERSAVMLDDGTVVGRPETPAYSVIAADVAQAAGPEWSDECMVILNRWQAAIDATPADYPASYKQYKSEQETGLMLFDTSELQLLLDADARELVSA